MPTDTKTLREWREFFRETQQEFAARLDVSISALAIWERGERVPQKRVQRRIAEKLHIKPEQVAFSDTHAKAKRVGR